MLNYVKFKYLNQTHDTHQYASMQIMDPDKIYNLPRKADITTKQIEEIKAFVIMNKKLLLQLINKEIEITDFLANMVCVGRLEKDDKPYIEQFKPINGFTMCRMGDKLNFLNNSTNEYIFKDFIIDDANNFYKLQNELLAWVKIGDESYFIDTNGNKVNI